MTPAEVLEQKLKESGMSRKELAIRTGVSEKHICTVINGDRGISAAFARKLGYVFETPSFWIELQGKHDAEQLRIQEENEISEDEISLLKPLHEFMQYCIERGLMHNNCGDASKVMQMREFLNVSDLTRIPEITYNAAYRAQLSHNSTVNPYVLFAWQRLCEKETERITVQSSINKDLLREKIDDIKAMMFGSINDGVQKLQSLFSECGIAFGVIRNFRGAPVQGFIKETADHRLILCLTIRGKRADSFWFTLFHEIAHVLNGDYSMRFVDFDSVQGEAEAKADAFARDTLINPSIYREFILSNSYISWGDICEFATKVGVKPFIVLGRLQKDGILDWTDYADKVVRYQWA